MPLASYWQIPDLESTSRFAAAQKQKTDLRRMMKNCVKNKKKVTNRTRRMLKRKGRGSDLAQGACAQEAGATCVAQHGLAPRPLAPLRRVCTSQCQPSILGSIHPSISQSNVEQLTHAFILRRVFHQVCSLAVSTNQSSNESARSMSRWMSITAWDAWPTYDVGKHHSIQHVRLYPVFEKSQSYFNTIYRLC